MKTGDSFLDRLSLGRLCYHDYQLLDILLIEGSDAMVSEYTMFLLVLILFIILTENKK